MIPQPRHYGKHPQGYRRPRKRAREDGTWIHKSSPYWKFQAPQNRWDYDLYRPPSPNHDPNFLEPYARAFNSFD